MALTQVLAYVLAVSLGNIVSRRGPVWESLTSPFSGLIAHVFFSALYMASHRPLTRTCCPDTPRAGSLPSCPSMPGVHQCRVSLLPRPPAQSCWTQRAHSVCLVSSQRLCKFQLLMQVPGSRYGRAGFWYHVLSVPPGAMPWDGDFQVPSQFSGFHF